MSRATAITGPLAALVERAGGVGPLAAALRVSEMTLWRWGTGMELPRYGWIKIAAVQEAK